MIIDPQHYHVHFDLFQQLVLWLSKSMHSHREGCHYLETNLPLMATETDKELNRLISAHAQDKPEMIQQMRHHLALLQDARQRGGTQAAIREAYVNMYGGFALDLPPWLIKIEEHLLFLSRLRRPERTQKTQQMLLRDALDYAQRGSPIAHEIIAELYNELGNALLQGPLPHTQFGQTQALIEAIACYEAALHVYTPEHYPLQHAKTQMHLGSAYCATGQPDAIEHAIACFKAARLVYTREAYPEEWMKLHISLGAAYAQRCNGNPDENIEQAITCYRLIIPDPHKSSPSTVESDANCTSFPSLQAIAHIQLGDVYRMRTQGVRSENLELARSCYRAALKTFTPQEFPLEWARIHLRLASLYQDFQKFMDLDIERQDLCLRCSIVCYEGTLHVYTPDAYLVEYATILCDLAHVHRIRLKGDRQHNLAQATRCYRTALQVFTNSAFPLKYRQTLLLLTETETLLRELNQ